MEILENRFTMLAKCGILKYKRATGCPSKQCGIENQTIPVPDWRFSIMNFSDFRMLLLQQFSRNSYKIKEMLRQIKKDRVKIEFSRSRNHLKKKRGSTRPPALIGWRQFLRRNHLKKKRGSTPGLVWMWPEQRWLE